jgi:heat shock protein HtpX
MTLLLAALFGLVYAVIVMIGTASGYRDFTAYLVMAGGMMFFQYLIGPNIVEWSMRVRYVSREEEPVLYAMVADQASRAGIPMPRVCISDMNIPNAFAFGRGVNDGRVCVTAGIMRLLNEHELKAVIGHEISHIKNRDVLTMTLLSVLPIVLYHLAWRLMFSGRRDDRGGGAVLVGLIAFVAYFVSNLLVMYASRIREYFADKGSVELGNMPTSLASALYKLVYGSARLTDEERHESEGFKAFFVNDPSRSRHEFDDLRLVDRDKNGQIDASELAMLRSGKVSIGISDRLMEAMSTHPNMLARIKHLSELGAV